MRKAMKTHAEMARLFVVLLIPLIFISCSPKKPSLEMRVSFLLGSAERGLRDQWSALNQGDRLDRENLVRTGKQSKLDIDLAGIAGLRLLDETTVDLASVTSDHMHFIFTGGNILMKAGKLGGTRQLMVETPTAVASIRGTQFWGQVRKEGQAGTFAVREGSIEITLKKTGEKVLLGKGDALDYSADQKRLEKRAAKSAEMGAMEQIDEISTGGRT